MKHAEIRCCRRIRVSQPWVKQSKYSVIIIYLTLLSYFGRPSHLCYGGALTGLSSPQPSLCTSTMAPLVKFCSDRIRAVAAPSPASKPQWDDRRINKSRKVWRSKRGSGITQVWKSLGVMDVTVEWWRKAKGMGVPDQSKLFTVLSVCEQLLFWSIQDRCIRSRHMEKNNKKKGSVSLLVIPPIRHIPLLSHHSGTEGDSDSFPCCYTEIFDVWGCTLIVEIIFVSCFFFSFFKSWILDDVCLEIRLLDLSLSSSHSILKFFDLYVLASLFFSFSFLLLLLLQ